MTKSKDDKGFGEQYVDEFAKILLSEISSVLKSHNIPVNNDTKRAFMAGASTSQSLSVELFNQKLMDLGIDPRLNPKISQNIPFSYNKRKGGNHPE